MHVVQCDVRGDEHYAQLVRCEHHRDMRARELREHLGVTGKIVAAGEERVLVDGCGDDPLHVAGECERRRALDRESGEATAARGAAAGVPLADLLVRVHHGAGGAHDHQLGALADARIGERQSHDLRARCRAGRRG